MPTFSSPAEMKDALVDLFIDGKLNDIDEGLKTQLRNLSRDGVSSVETTINVAEIVYARHEDGEKLPVELLQLGADAADLAVTHNFHGYAFTVDPATKTTGTGRGHGIVSELRKVKGVKSPTASAEPEKPSPKAEFQKPKEVKNPPA